MRIRKIQDVADKALYSMKKDKQSDIIISGDVGDGKSSLGIQLCKAIQPDFNIETGVVCTGSMEEYERKYGQLKQLGALQIDEAVKILYSMDFAKTTTKALVKKMVADQRKEKNAAYIFCAPNMYQLLKYLKGSAKIWIECLPREWYDGKSYAMVFVRERSTFNIKDPWLIEDYFKKEVKMLRFGSDRTTHLNLLMKHPFFKGIIKFKPLGVRPYKKYRTMIDREKIRALNTPSILSSKDAELRKQESTLVDKLIRFIHIELGLSFKAIKVITGISESTLSSRSLRAEPQLKGI